jgi:integrase
MKGRVAHTVPLTPRALAILREARAAYPKSDFVFPGTKPALPLSDMTLTKVLRDAGLHGKATAHGFRSSCCRVWGFQSTLIFRAVSLTASGISLYPLVCNGSRHRQG